MRSSLTFRLLTAGALLALAAPGALAQGCPEEAPLQNYTGTGGSLCPCFASGEQAGAVLEAPAEHYPLEILRVGIAWGSQYGGTGQQLEQSIHIYGGGLPDPGSPIFSLDGPVLTDGAINEFDLEPLPGEIVVDSGPFTVTLEFLNANAGDYFAPSMLFDSGCQANRNVVYAIPGGWLSACALGVTGDWVVYAVYRQVDCLVGVGDEYVLGGGLRFLSAWPNPTRGRTELAFQVPREGTTSVSVHDLRGRLVADLASRTFPTGTHTVLWDGRGDDGRAVAAGVYFVQVRQGNEREVRRVVVVR